MGERLDTLRSLLHRAAKAGADRLQRLPPVANARHVLDELKERRARITEATLSSAVAHAPGVRACSASIQGGLARLDITYDDGATLSFGVTPESVRFAPRGAKEVLFSVEPPERVNEARVRDAVGCVAAAIARTLWGPMLPPREGDEQALVERDGARLRADMRTVPAVRAALEGSPLAMALEVLTIESFTVEDRAIRLKNRRAFPDHVIRPRRRAVRFVDVGRVFSPPRGAADRLCSRREQRGARAVPERAEPRDGPGSTRESSPEEAPAVVSRYRPHACAPIERPLLAPPSRSSRWR